MERLVFITDDRCPVARAAAVHLRSMGYRVVFEGRGGEPLPGMEYTDLDINDADSISSCFSRWGDDFYAVILPAPPPMHASIEEADEQQWEAAFREGALASMMVTGAAGECLARLGRGALIYLGSIHAEKPMGYGFFYSMGCAATQMLCREAALDYGARGVNCFYVQRGVMEYDQSNANDITNVYSSTGTRYPRQRMPEHGSLNELLAFLLTDGASPLSGSDLRADGGLTLFYGHHREEAVRP